MTIGGSGGMGSRKDTRKKAEPEDSEEELVYFTSESMGKKDGGIMKKTELHFDISERQAREGDLDDQIRVKPWEMRPHAS